MVHAPSFDGFQDLDIHVRTTIRYDYSYIEAAAIKIGQDILEVGSFGSYSFNGVDDALKPNGMAAPLLSGYPVYHNQISENKHHFDIVVALNKNITLSVFKDWVGVHIRGEDEKSFGEVSGLLGSFYGELKGRDGKDLSKDINALGQEWQVRDDEPMLFRTSREPQYPAKCFLPDETAARVAAAERRRLGQSVEIGEAEQACAHFTGSAFKFCVHDVMVSGDLEVASGVAF